MAVLFSGIAAVDPDLLYRSCTRRADPVPTDRWWGKANVFRVPLGRGHGYGHVLLKKSALDALALTADHDLAFSGTNALTSLVGPAQEPAELARPFGGENRLPRKRDSGGAVENAGQFDGAAPRNAHLKDILVREHSSL